MKGEFICKANRITETHPLAYQMGDIKDIEDYKQKIENNRSFAGKLLRQFASTLILKIWIILKRINAKHSLT